MREQSTSESNLTNTEYADSHAVFWWAIKVTAGAIIIAGLFIAYIYHLQPWFSVPRLFAQSLVLIGGIGAIYHYLKLRSDNRNVQTPEHLVTNVGLYRFVRHPMYLCDIVAYSGLFLLHPSMLIALVLIVGYVALVQQARVEDQYLSQRFDSEFSRWEKRSKLLIPFVY